MVVDFLQHIWQEGFLPVCKPTSDDWLSQRILALSSYFIGSVTTKPKEMRDQLKCAYKLNTGITIVPFILDELQKS